MEEGGAVAGGGRMCEEEGRGKEGGEYLGGGWTKAAAAATHDDGYWHAGESEISVNKGRSCTWGQGRDSCSVFAETRYR